MAVVCAALLPRSALTKCPEQIHEALALLSDSRVDPGERGHAAICAAAFPGAMGEDRVLTAIRAAVSDRETLVREGALQALGRSSVPADVERIASALEDSKLSVRGIAVYVLASRRSPERDQAVDRYLEPLLTALASTLADERRIAVEALGSVPELRSILVARGRGTADPLVGLVGDPAASVRLAVIRAVRKQIGSVLMAAGLERPEAAVLSEPLRTRLKDPDARVRREASALLGELRVRLAGEELMRLAERDEAPSVRLAACGALKQLLASSVFEAPRTLLERLRRDSDRRVSACATQAIEWTTKAQPPRP